MSSQEEWQRNQETILNLKKIIDSHNEKMSKGVYITYEQYAGEVKEHEGLLEQIKYSKERIDELERQLAEAQKDQADAKRYRWLRNDANGYNRAGPLVFWASMKGEAFRQSGGQSLDDELDYAMGVAIAQQKVKT